MLLIEVFIPDRLVRLQSIEVSVWVSALQRDLLPITGRQNTVASAGMAERG
jgi:hypothetical protein